MPAHKRLTDQQIDTLMQEFRTQRLRLREFAVEKGIPIPTFRCWFKEWEVWQRDARLSALPEKPLAWLPPENLSGYKEAPPLLRVKTPSICPHGQPILFKISGEDLQKRFEREITLR